MPRIMPRVDVAGTSLHGSDGLSSDASIDGHRLATANSGPQVDGEADAALHGALLQSPVPRPPAWVRGDRSHARRTRPSPSSSARANRRPLGRSETCGRPP